MKHHRGLVAIALVLAAGAFATPAFAQASLRPTFDNKRMDDAIKIYQDGVAQYQKGEFKVAEKKFDDFLAKVGDHAGGNFMMGLVQIELQDIDKARIFLRSAVKYDPEMVSAKGYLGAIEYFMGDPAKGQEQKAALETMKAACAETCAKAADIDQAIERIDANAAAVAAEGS